MTRIVLIPTSHLPSDKAAAIKELRAQIREARETLVQVELALKGYAQDQTDESKNNVWLEADLLEQIGQDLANKADKLPVGGLYVKVS